MEIDVRITNYCKFCKYRQATLDSRIFNCSLTKKAPDFEGECKTYWEDPTLIKNEKKKLKRENEAHVGKKRFIYFSSIIIGLSLSSIVFGTFTFYNYQNLDHLKGIFRLVIELGMLFAIYNGNSLIKNLFTIFCVLGIIILIFSISNILQVSMWGLVLVPLIIIYAYAIYFLNGDKYFLSFFETQKGE